MGSDEEVGGDEDSLNASFVSTHDDELNGDVEGREPRDRLCESQSSTWPHCLLLSYIYHVPSQIISDPGLTLNIHTTLGQSSVLAGWRKVLHVSLFEFTC